MSIVKDPIYEQDKDLHIRNRVVYAKSADNKLYYEPTFETVVTEADAKDWFLKDELLIDLGEKTESIGPDSASVTAKAYVVPLYNMRHMFFGFGTENASVFTTDPTPIESGIPFVEPGTTDMWGTLVSDMQSGLVVDNENKKIKGTLKYLDEGQLVTNWGAGCFMALHFTIPDEYTTSCLVGLDPSVSSGLAEILGDPDMNGVFKITSKDEQKFVIKTTDNLTTTEVEYDLSELVFEGAPDDYGTLPNDSSEGI